DVQATPDELYNPVGTAQPYQDSLFGSPGNDHIRAGEQLDWVGGGSGDNRAWGDAGNDIIFGKAGNNKLNGSEGNDILLGGNITPLMKVGAGGTAGNDRQWRVAA
ncbi:MAG: calcium-binding protein, partial [Rhodocyclaceae bacterium]|nr:calcium-binding protein [Rhodocyclaceae bacterium]MBU4038039.1 calcium-binding protein [Pseudomonadota bacterium]